MARKTKKAVKKKQWVSLVAPDKTPLGESHVSEPESMIGRHVKVSLMNLMNDPKKRKYNVIFKIEAIKDGQAITVQQGYEMQANSVKVAIRKKKDRIDHQVTVTTKDEVKVLLKPLLITRSNTTNLVKTGVRKAAEKHLQERAQKEDFNTFFKHVVQGDVQRELRKALSKVYPLQGVEMRKMQRVSA